MPETEKTFLWISELIVLSSHQRMSQGHNQLNWQVKANVIDLAKQQNTQVTFCWISQQIILCMWKLWTRE